MQGCDIQTAEKHQQGIPPESDGGFEMKTEKECKDKKHDLNYVAWIEIRYDMKGVVLSKMRRERFECNTCGEIFNDRILKGSKVGS